MSSLGPSPCLSALPWTLVKLKLHKTVDRDGSWRRESSRTMRSSSCWRKFQLKDAVSTEESGSDRTKKLSTLGGDMLPVGIDAAGLDKLVS